MRRATLLLCAALALCARSAAADPAHDRAQAEATQAQALASHAKLPEAIRHFERATALAPEVAAYHRALAGCLARNGDFPKAKVEYEKFIALAPNDPSVPAIRDAIGELDSNGRAAPAPNALVNDPQTGAARGSTARATPCSATTAEGLLQQGMANARANALESSLECLRAARKLTPTDPEVLRALAGMLARAGHFPEAAEVYRAFLKVAPNDPAAPSIRNALESYGNAR